MCVCVGGHVWLCIALPGYRALGPLEEYVVGPYSNLFLYLKCDTKMM